MMRAITTVDDVYTFFQKLFDEGINAHPDEDFTQYINVETGDPTYTEREANLRNLLMQQAFDTCAKSSIDLYDMMQEFYLKKTGLHKFIPLPSSECNQNG
jgi:hypothetical protein